MVARREDLAGRRFGRLTILGDAPRRPGNRHIRWRWRCDCGKEGDSAAGNLRCGKAQSCGCLQREKAAVQGRVIGLAKTTHGMTDTPEYERWHGMMLRCYCPTQPAYPRYGGRGIKVCERWHRFENFYADMGPRPSARHSLDRFPDTNGDYCPENCRWATNRQQCRNKGNNHVLTHEGESRCLAEWAERYGLTTLQLWRRIAYGWPVNLALTTPIGTRPPNLNSVRLPIGPAIRLKADARAAVFTAVRKGTIPKAARCQHPDCPATQVEAHHHRGYAREHRLDVLWLCKRHHQQAEEARG